MNNLLFALACTKIFILDKALKHELTGRTGIKNGIPA
jgi:hypothetical protein